VKIQNVSLNLIDWGTIKAIEHRGQTGTSFGRTIESGNIRVRIVEYSPGFESDHYCERGHVLFVMEGEVTIRLKDGHSFHLKSDMSILIADNEMNPHAIISSVGAKVFIVD
jgi:mannose-6-phosphate isomerase-like protein (cupin superfamily)